jgi:outer membrane protein assembly factor BamB
MPKTLTGTAIIGYEDKKSTSALSNMPSSRFTNPTSGTSTRALESSPAVAYDNVYVGSSDRKVYCLNASTGTLIWNYTSARTLFLREP